MIQSKQWLNLARAEGETRMFVANSRDHGCGLTRKCYQEMMTNGFTLSLGVRYPLIIPLEWHQTKDKHTYKHNHRRHVGSTSGLTAPLRG